MSEDLKYDRRRFLGAAAMTIAGGPVAMIESADTRPRKISVPAGFTRCKVQIAKRLSV
jgi:hypothetical protein